MTIIENSAIAFEAELACRPASAVYSGKPGCACGCNGNHTSTERSKKLILGKMRRAIEEGRAIHITVAPGIYVAVDTATRVYIAYTDGRIS